MAEAIDIEARDRISELDKRFTEVSNDYWGPNRDNGTRSIVRAHDVKLDELGREMRHYVDTLPERCLGLKALAEFEAQDGEEAAEVTVAKLTSKGKLSEARLSLIGIVLVAVLSLVGQAISAQQSRTTQQQLVVLTHALEQTKQP